MSARGERIEHIGLFWQIQPGLAEDYDRRHATVWPELEQCMRELGVTGFSIFRRDHDVFAHVAVRDYAEMTAAYNVDPIALAWEERFADILIVEHPDAITGWPERLRFVWALEDGGGRS